VQLVVWLLAVMLRGAPPERRCRSTLVLQDAAAGFGDPSALKPLLVTADGYNRTAAAAKEAGWWHQGENANDVFYNQLHHVDLRLGANNSGATGVLWHPAQGTSVRDVSVDASGGAFSSVDYGSCTGYYNISGTDDGGGGGTLEGIRTRGGRYGVRGGGTNWMFRSVHVADAAVAGLLLNTGSWNNVLLDVRVSGAPVAVNLSQHNNNIVMLDALLDAPPGGTGLNLFHMNPNETGIALSRVTVRGGDYVVRGPTEATSIIQAASGSSTLRAWRSGGFEFVDGQEQRLHGSRDSQLAVFGALTPARPDMPLPLRSKPRVTAAFNVLEAGAVGDCRTDDTNAIRSSLASHDIVFLPATAGQNGGGPQEGCYLVSDTLTLRSNTTLLGEGGSLLKLAPHAAGFGDRAHPKPLLQTEDDRYSTTVLMDVLLDVGDQTSGNPGTILIQWRAGQGSLHDVHPRLLGPAHLGIHVTGSGGGFIDNSWVWGADHNQSFGSAHIPGRETMCSEPYCPGANIGILIDSAGPTFLYGTNSEHHVQTSYRFDGAKNIYFLMGQNEYRTFGPSDAHSAMCTSDAMQVLNSHNIHIYGVSACSWKCLGPGTAAPLVTVRNSSQVSFTGMYSACVKGTHSACYFLGERANDTRFGMGATHVIAAQWHNATGVQL
jgi:glucan 1,3-beta-glucosidase